MDNINISEREKQVLELRDKGYSYGKIAELLNMNKSTVAWYSKRKYNEDLNNKKKQKEKEDNEYERIVCETVPKATSMNNLCFLMNKRGTNNNYLYFQQIIDKYHLNISHFSSIPPSHINRRLDKEDIFCKNDKPITTKTLKNNIFKYGLKEYRCECCHNTQWNGQEIPLQVHHKNGDRTDNNIENLELLCPNCHAQTDNFAGKNINANMRKKYKCICCEKEFYKGEGSSKHSTIYCSIACRDKMNGKRNQYVKVSFKDDEAPILINRPSKEQLVQDYRELGGWQPIGRKYNVDGNSVKKWFKKYGLPFDVKGIRKYIIELFGKQPQWTAYMFNEYGERKDMILKEVDAYDLNGNFIKTYRNVKHVQKELGLTSSSSIRDVCNGKRKQYDNYIFSYH